MRPHRHFQIAFLLAAALAAGTANADNRNWQFGLLYGLSVPDAVNTQPFHLFEVEGKSFVTPNLSVGGYYAQSDKSGQRGSDDQFHYSMTGGEIAYHWLSTLSDTFIGFRVGMSKLTETVSSTDVIFSPYHYGAAVGYDYYLGTYFSIGFESSYLHMFPNRVTDDSGSVYQSKSFDMINILISLQFRL